MVLMQTVPGMVLEDVGRPLEAMVAEEDEEEMVVEEGMEEAGEMVQWEELEVWEG